MKFEKISSAPVYEQEDQQIIPGSIPDRNYFTKVLKRQWFAAFIVGIFIAALGMIGSKGVKNLYRSQSALTSNNDDSSGVNLRGGTSRVFSMTGATSFTVRFSDPEFLYKVGKLVKIDKLIKSGLRYNISTFLFGPMSQSEERAAISELLKDRLFPVISEENGVLYLTVLMNSPKMAQELNSRAIELFVKTELESYARELRLKTEFLKQRLYSNSDDPSKFSENLKKPIRKNDEKSKLNRRQKEADLVDQITRLQSKIDGFTKQNIQRRVTLENELSEMTSRLKSTHPDVIAKRSELRSVEIVNRPTLDAMKNLQVLRQELWKTRGRLRYSKGGSESGLEERLETERVSAITQKIAEYELEADSIERQISKPDLRTRFRIVTPPSFEPVAESNRSHKVLLSTMVIAFFAAFFTIVWREIRSPLARDGWRIVLLTKKIILSQFGKKSLAAFSIITPKIADDMRTNLRFSKNKNGELSNQSLLAYRNLELSLRKHCKGKVILFMDIGTNPERSLFYYNFGNIFSTDTVGKTIIIDFNITAPIRQGLVPQANVDFIDCLLEKASLKQVIQQSSDKCAFDIIRAPKNYSGSRTRAFQVAPLQKILHQLSLQYDLLFVRGFPDNYFIENNTLIASVSDVIMTIDAAKTTYSQVSRTLSQCSTDKTRGLVLFAT